MQAQPPVEPAVVVPVAEPPRSAAPPSASSAPAVVRASPPCDFANLLYVRHEAYPRPPAFEAAAQAFDRSTEAYEQKRYLDAARGFMVAARSFLDAADVEDRRWSYGNAVSSWEMIGNLEEARAALLDAATRDSELAEELRAMAEDLHTVCAER